MHDVNPCESQVADPMVRWLRSVALIAFALVAPIGCVGGGGGGGGGGGTGGGGELDRGADVGSDATVCEPDCEGRVCGPDGCEGTCGVCGDEQVCAGGACEAVPASCGDDACGDGETCETCEADCGPCCGDGTCDADLRETCTSCAADCGCAEGERCDPAANACVAQCTPDCAGRVCGSDGCGGECGACGEGVCDADGQCVAPPDSCGDDACDDGEDCSNCAGDCGCGDDERCDRGACIADCPDDCGPLWQASCTADGFGYRLCTPDAERPRCTAPSRRILCGDGRDCRDGDGGASCAGRCLRPEVLLLVDRSSSMEGARWQFTRSALVDMASARSSFVRLGLRMFPGEVDGCAAGPVVAPVFDATAAFEAMPAPAQVAQTPIASALEGVGDAFGDPDEGESVILVTDGDETCAGEFDATGTAAALRLRGVRTFVIGIGREANGDLLTAIATAGGTADLGPAPYLAVEDGPELRAALDGIFALLETGRAEQCNGADDDCDGVVDEALTPPLSERQDGVCGGAVQRCDGAWVEPDYAAIEGYEAEEVTCDARDNDCDGFIDEALDPPPAERQDGVCVGAVQVCAEGWIEPEYGRIEGFEQPEASCDGLDNDCDGVSDEALDAPLASIQRGICAGAEQVCAGRWRDPDYAGLAGHELPEVSCDGRDNDCDGAIDEQLDAPLAELQAGVCGGVLQVCAGRWVEPDYARVAEFESPEVTCEGLDNDCDGAVDEDTECPVICGRNEAGPPCNRCPEGTFVPPGWVCAPAGVYTRGSPIDEEGSGNDEGQVETTIARAFLIQATEVTRGQWNALVARDPARNHHCAADDPELCPVASVNWWEAAAYANALSAAARPPLTPCYGLRNCRGELGGEYTCDLEVDVDPECTGYRLPTEEQWEYAARADTVSRFWSGDGEADLARVDWYLDNAGDMAHGVAERPANAWGLYDVHGNVREWCHEWRIDNFTRALRGGGWRDETQFCRSAERWDYRPRSISQQVGMRLVRPASGAGCGNGVCDALAGERCDTCRADCGACCGDGVCDGAVGETCESCAADCACEGGLACHRAQCVDCVPSCDGLACGSDGCGGSCGECAPGAVCEAGACRGTGIELIVDEATPLISVRQQDVVAVVPDGYDAGRIEDAHGRLVTGFEPTGQPGRYAAAVSWAALSTFEPVDGGRRERRALYAVFELDGEAVRLPFTVRLLCPGRQMCLGECFAEADACDRGCPEGCQPDQVCVDRACIDRVGGVALVDLSPRITGLRPGETAPRSTKGTALAVHLDQPAPAGGAVVRLESLDPAVVVPAQLLIPAGEQSARVEVVVAGSTHGAGIIARLGAATQYAEIRVVPAAEPAPALIINEIDYDQPGVDMAEFVELYNPTGAAQPVDRLALLFVNGDDDGDPYLTVPLVGLAPVPAGGYALVGDDVGAAAPRLPLDGEVQGGDSDGVLLVDTVSGAVLDGLAYDGFLLGVTEGAAQSSDLRGDRQESFSRCPDGRDQNRSDLDFARVIPTPGAPNACP